MLENKKIKNGLKKMLFAITLAFPGPIFLIHGLGFEKWTITKMLIVSIGAICMLGSVIIGFLAIKEMLDGFFQESNE